MKQLLAKIQLVAKDCMSIDKDMKVGSGSYAYKAVSDLAVTKKVKNSEQKHGIISVPIKQDLVKTEIVKIIKGDKEAISYVDVIKLTLRIYDLESEKYIDVESFGRGLDSGDKGFGKAATYARKYALLNAYKITTGEDPDAEKSKKQSTITVKEKNIIVISYLEKNNDYAVNVFSHFGITAIEELSDIHINSIYKSLKDKKKL